MTGPTHDLPRPVRPAHADATAARTLTAEPTEAEAPYAEPAPLQVVEGAEEHDRVTAREARRDAVASIALGGLAIVTGMLAGLVPHLLIDPFLVRVSILLVWATFMVSALLSGARLLRALRWARSHAEPGEQAPPGRTAMWVGGLAGVALALVSWLTAATALF